MSIPAYTLGYPPDGSTLGQTKSTIRNNLDGTYLTLAVDHINNNGQPGSQPAGYHTIIHQVTQTSVATTTGYNQVFSGVPGTLVVNAVTTPTIPPGGDTQLYTLSSGGVLSQLTGSSLTTNGYAWIGGILIQWGTQSIGSTPVAFLFPETFPNNIFSISALRNQTTNSVLGYTGLSTSGVTLVANGASSPQPTKWTAIGN